MSQSRSVRPVVEQFRDAANWLSEKPAFKLLNEWRDTVSYGLLAATAVAVELTHPAAALPLNRYVLPFAVAMREGVRSMNWQRHKKTEIAGISARRLDIRKLSNSASVVAGLAAMVQPLLALSSLDTSGKIVFAGLLVAEAVAVAPSILKSEGPSEIATHYRDTMWDYPHKKGDGGTTQTEKLKDGFRMKWQSTAEALGQLIPSPQPTLVPVPVRSPRAGVRREALSSSL